jgi:quercetin dioxygenase-like cupin family protein
MIISRFDELKEFQTSEGVMKPLFVSEELKVIHLKIPAGLKVRPHSHPSPGNLLLLKGAIKLNAVDPVLLQEGDVAHIPADYTVGLESETEAEALLISSPSGYKTIEELYERLEGFQK